MTPQRATVVSHRTWKRLGLALLFMGMGLGSSTMGLAGDFYEHEIVGFSPELESIFAPIHLLIFGGIAITALGFLLAAVALRREGHSPLGMYIA